MRSCLDADHFEFLDQATTEPASRAISEKNLLAHILHANGVTFQTREVDPDKLYRLLLFGRNEGQAKTIAEHFTVLAYPGQAPQRPLQTGDILLRVTLGHLGLGHVAVVADPTLWSDEELASAPFRAERQQPGFYAVVSEAGAYPHSPSQPFARRILDNLGQMLPGQLLLRLKSYFTGEEVNEPETSGTKAPARFYQEVLDALAKQKDPALQVILQKLLELCQAVEKQEKALIPKLLDDSIKLIKDFEQTHVHSRGVLSDSLAIELAIRLFLMGLEAESKRLRQYAASLSAWDKGYRGKYDEEAYIRNYEADFWVELVARILKSEKPTDVETASRAIDRLVKIFGDIRTLVFAYKPEIIRKEREYGEGPRKYLWTTHQKLFDLFKLLFIGMQHRFQFILDVALTDLGAGKGFHVLEQLQQILESKILKSIFPDNQAQWVNGLDVEVTSSKFEKKGGLHLDSFLEDKAARDRSAIFKFYDAEGDYGSEKMMSLGRIFQIRRNQMSFLKWLYGVPNKEVVTVEEQAERQENQKLIRKMSSGKFRLHNNNDWREFLLLKFRALRAQPGLSAEEIWLRTLKPLQAYLKVFTLQTHYDVYDRGPENYLQKIFPRALTGQLLHDCGVYALRSAYILALIRREQNLLFRFVYLPAHVGLIVNQTDMSIPGKRRFLPLFTIHNNFVEFVGELSKVVKIRKDWETWHEPVPASGATPKSLPTDDVQFQGELAAPIYISGPIDLPFRLVDVPDDPKLTSAALKSKLWDFYIKESSVEIFGPETHDAKSEVYQIHLQYLELIQKFKNIWNSQIMDFWNGQVFPAWNELDESMQKEASKSNRILPYPKAVAFVKRYQQQLTEARRSKFDLIVRKLRELDEEKKTLTAKVHAHPKLKKSGIRFSHGRRAADFYHRFEDLFDEFEKGVKVSQGKAEMVKEFGLDRYLEKVKGLLARLERRQQEISIQAIYQSIKPSFTSPLEPID
jgi:hypothetical protein